MRSSETDLAAIAARQHGVVARTQALELGMSSATIDRRLQSGLWQPVHRGVYRLPGARPTWRANLLAACFAWGPDAVGSHTSAAALRRLVAFEAGALELTVPYGRHRNGPGIVHRADLDPLDVEVVDAIPVTTVARTLIDLAGTQPRDDVEDALDDALYRGLVSRRRLLWRIDALAANGRAGVGVMRELLEERDGMVSVPQSRFETRLLSVLKRGGIPKPEVQYPIKIGTRTVFADFAYPDAGLALEADSRKFHIARSRFEGDRERTNALVAIGWRVMRITWVALRSRPDSVVDAVGRALAVRA
jgi:very-short-patch-repair endonuclease/predicted transcriptional regulator of viral defense system